MDSRSARTLEWPNIMIKQPCYNCVGMVQLHITLHIFKAAIEECSIIQQFLYNMFVLNIHPQGALAFRATMVDISTSFQQDVDSP